MVKAKGIEPLSLEASINKYSPFMMEIRKRLLFAFSIFLISGIIGFTYYEKIVRVVLKLLNLQGVNIVFTSPFQFVNLAISSALIVATVATFPFILIQLLSFLEPALKKREYKSILRLLPLGILLFGLGFYFGLMMMKYVVSLFTQKALELNIGNFLDISKFLSTVLSTSVLMGIAFQYPIVLAVLAQLGIVKYEMLKKQRVYAYTASLVFAALLPPTDILSLALLTLPLVILFETTLILIRLFVKPGKD